MKLQSKVRNRLEGVANHLERAVAYLNGPNVAGIAHVCAWPNGGDYTIRCPKEAMSAIGAKHEHIRVMNHHYGSNLTGLEEGLRQLRALLAQCEQ